MDFHIFTPRNSGEPDFTAGIHEEKTRYIHRKPDPKGLEQGVIICENCECKVLINSNPGLGMAKCPACSTSNFIPMLIKDYWLYEPLGGGGMGCVYHAFHRCDSNLEFAVKVLNREMRNDKFLIDSLVDEAKIGCRFGNHPHLTKVYEYGIWKEEYYAVYEFIDGIRLDQIIESPVKRTDKQIILWTLQMLSAEQHIFDCGYLFRDLKPQNVIIDRNGNVKMIDYGLAISIEEAINGDKSDQIVGSPHYIPPERIEGAPESQYSEIYSLGMLLYHLISRTTYYSSEDVRKLVEKHVSSLRMADFFSKLPPKTNPEVARILMKMIKRDPSSRYQSYKELGAELFREFKNCA
ncbi:MAG: serine/threonine-protein kinase [Victivallales bacterium]